MVAKISRAAAVVMASERLVISASSSGSATCADHFRARSPTMIVSTMATAPRTIGTLSVRRAQVGTASPVVTISPSGRRAAAPQRVPARIITPSIRAWPPTLSSIDSSAPGIIPPSAGRGPALRGPVGSRP